MSVSFDIAEGIANEANIIHRFYIYNPSEFDIKRYGTKKLCLRYRKVIFDEIIKELSKCFIISFTAKGKKVVDNTFYFRIRDQVDIKCTLCNLDKEELQYMEIVYDN